MKAHTPKVESDYLGRYFDRKWFNEILNKALRDLKGIEFDAIAFRGISGALTAPVVAYTMSKSLIAVRKEAGTHSSMLAEGDRGALTYIIVDDFSVTGKTKDAIIEAVKDFNPDAKFLGLYSMHFNTFDPA